MVITQSTFEKILILDNINIIPRTVKNCIRSPLPNFHRINLERVGYYAVLIDSIAKQGIWTKVIIIIYILPECNKQGEDSHTGRFVRFQEEFSDLNKCETFRNNKNTNCDLYVIENLIRLEKCDSISEARLEISLVQQRAQVP